MTRDGDAGWRESVQDLVPVDASLGDELVTAAEARRLLRCDGALLDDLVRWGLPSQERAGGIRFSLCDVMNVGLYSGSGKSVAEIAERFITRFTTGEPSAWEDERQWRLTAKLRCPRGAACRDPRWVVPPPEPSERVRPEPWSDLPAHPGTRNLTTAAVVRGMRAEVESPEAKGIYEVALDHLVSGRWRYQYLPPALRLDPDAASERGVMDCVSCSLWLEQQARAAGLQARTRRGVLLAVTGIEHAWAEIQDEDETWKPLDPILAALSARRAGGNPAFRAYACGSYTNRTVAWAAEADAGIFAHACVDDAGRREAQRVVVSLSASAADREAA